LAGVSVSVVVVVVVGFVVISQPHHSHVGFCSQGSIGVVAKLNPTKNKINKMLIIFFIFFV